MPDYAYRAVSPSGSTVSGTVSGFSSEAARSELVGRGILPIEIAAVVKARNRVRRSDGLATISYVASLLGAGLTLEHALRISRDVTDRPSVRVMIESLLEELNAGRSLAEAMDKQSAVFSGLVRGIVRAGEMAGSLDATLARLADFLVRRQQLRSRIISAMIYPVLMLTVGIASVLFLVGYVLPQFEDLLADSGVALPLSTRVLLGSGDALGVAGPPFLLAVGLVSVGLLLALQNPSSRRVLHGLLLRVPLVGTFRSQHAAVHLGHTLSSLLSEGVPALEALDNARDAVPDEAIRHLLLTARADVEAGQPLAASLKKGQLLPTVFTEMLDVGERSGRLPELLKGAADTLEQSLTASLERSVRLVEPAAILIFGALIAGVAFGLLEAIYGIHGGVL